MLETALQENTAALKLLAEILTRGGLPAPLAPVANPNAGPKAAKKAPEEKPAKETVAAPAEAPKGAAPATLGEEYAPVKAAVLEAAKAGKREGIKKVLDKYGVENARELNPKDYAEATAAFKALTAPEAENDDLA